MTIDASGTYTVTVAAAASAHSLTLDTADATLAIASGLTIGTTLAAAAGTLSLNTGGSINGGTVVAGGATVAFAGGTLNGVTWQGPLILGGIAETATMTGANTLTGTGGIGAGTLDLTGQGDILTVSGTIAGIGTLALNAGTLFVTSSGTVAGAATGTNTGDLELHNGGAISVTGTFTNSNTLNVDTAYNMFSGATEGGSRLTIGGLFYNLGAVQVGDSSLALGAATTVTLGGLTNGSGASFVLYGSAKHAITLAFSGGGFTGNAGDFEMTYGGPLTLNNGFTNTGTFGLHDDMPVTVNGSFANSGTLDLDTVYNMLSGASEGGSSLTIAGTLDNTNVVQVGDTGLAVNAATTLTLGGLINGNGGSFALYGSTKHAVTLALSGGGTGFASNAGYFALTYATPLTLSTSFTNSGTFEVHNDTVLTVTGGFTNSGALNVDDGYNIFSGLTEGGSSLTIAGTLDNTGAVLVGDTSMALGAASTLTLGGLYNRSGASFILDGSALDAATLAFSAGGAGFVTNAGNFALTYGGPLTINNSFTNSGTFGLHDDSHATVTGGFNNSGTLNVDTGFNLITDYNEGGSSLTIDGTLANTGTVQVGDTKLALNAAATLTIGALQNSGSISLYGGSSTVMATMQVMGVADNAGILNIGNFAALQVTGGNTFTQTSGTTTVKGTIAAAAIDIDGGTLAIDTSNFTNTNTLLASGGGLIDFSGGSLTNISGTTLTGGTYEVNAGSTLRFASGVTIATDNADIMLAGTGAVVESGSSTLLGARLTSIGTAGVLALLSGGSLNATQALQDNGLLQLGNGSFSGSTLTVSATGTVDGFGTVAAAIQAGGAIEANGGTLLLSGNINGTDTVTIAAGATLEIGGTVQSGITIDFAGPNSRLILDDPTGFAGSVESSTPLTPISAVTVSGTAYTLAAPVVSTTTLQLGAARVGGTVVSQALTLGNGTTAGPDAQSLVYVAGTPGGSFDVLLGGSGTIAAGATATAEIGLQTTIAGSFTGSILPIALSSVASGVGNVPVTTLPEQTITLDGTVFAAAVAQLSTASVNFGIVHVGTSVSQTLTIANTATGALTDVLLGTFGTVSSPFTGNGTLVGVAAGSTGTLLVGLSATASGVETGTATLALASHDADLSDIAVSTGTISLVGTVDNYATAAIEKLSGSGSLGQNGNVYTLNLGTVDVGGTALTADLGVLNAATGLADLMSGSIAATGSAGFTNSGLAAFSGLGAGQADIAPSITLSTVTVGSFSETVTLTAAGSNASSYFGTLAPETLTVTGVVLSTVTISGTEADQATSDSSSLLPFSAVTIGDSNVGQTETVTVTQSATANGVLSILDGGTYVNRVYTITGSAAAVTSALDGLVFTPTPHQVAPGQTVTTGFTITDTDAVGSASTDTTSSVVATAVAVPGFAALDTTTDQAPPSAVQPYTGPVSGLQNEYISVTNDSLNITVSTPNWFIHSGSGDDAIAVSSGTNVLDGGTGSNFLTGGSGTDTFFVDDRGPTADIWSTVNNFHAGDAATIWGVTPQDFEFSWVDGQGAVGYTGLTLHATAPGLPTASLTLVGFTSADLTNGRLTVSFGTTPTTGGVPGSTYMYIYANS